MYGKTLQSYVDFYKLPKEKFMNIYSSNTYDVYSEVALDIMTALSSGKSPSIREASRTLGSSRDYARVFVHLSLRVIDKRKQSSQKS